MKKLLFNLLLICNVFSVTIAQNGDFRSQMNAIFENVDLTQVPSGILSDYGLSLVDDSLYNGQIVSDNILSPQIWRGLYSDLWSGQVDVNSNMFDLTTVNSRIESHASDDVAVIPRCLQNPFVW
ncbi:hypothetical protein [Ancylomarina longa]|nr:hypothetical protein [Ancylomarina longa]